MAMVNKTRNMIEGLVREGSFKWLIGNRGSFDEEFQEIGRSQGSGKNWIPELSPIANIIVGRCSKILGISASELQENFNSEASDTIKHPSRYARNFLEYCCLRALSLSTHSKDCLGDKKFRRLTFDMMLAWEAPAATSEPFLKVDEDATAGIEAFSRIAPAIPIIANVIISDNLFEVLTSSTANRLHFSIYDKYLSGLERALKKLRAQSESSLLSPFRAARGEKIIEVDGTVTTQPVLQHVGISTWPGRLVLTDHALYFEALRMVSFDKAKRYDLSDDLKQVVKPELTGPWGTRLFDKAVLYKSISLSEPVVFEFPELKGHTRRDYWLAIIREVLYVHRFIHKFQITGVERDEAISMAVFGILRLQAALEITSGNHFACQSLLMFNLCDQLPGGDLISETLANMLHSRGSDRTNNYFKDKDGMYSSAVAVGSNLGYVFGSGSNDPNRAGLLVGEISVGEMSVLERAVKESRSNYNKVKQAQASVDGVKMDGIDTNLAVMKELLFPLMELGKHLLSLAYWEDPLKSFMFCSVVTYIICRGWLGYMFALLLIFIAIFTVLTRYLSNGKSVNVVKVTAPQPMNTMEQLLTVQNVISQAEVFIQDGNIVLLKMRALLLSIFPQASEKFAVALVTVALTMALVPSKYVLLFMFLETFTRYSPPRKAITERWMRRLREWWFSIPAAPVVVEKEKEEKNKKL